MATAGILSAAIMWAAVGGGATAMAFDHPWNLDGCVGVAAGSHGLWDDAPGGGFNNESAFFWVRNSAAGDEQCSWRSFVGVSSSSFPSLQVRVATNDSARFTVRLISHAGAILATINVAGAAAHSGFLVLNANIPAGHEIALARVTLDDAPDAAVSSGRSSALIDYIRIWNPGAGAVGWVENFSRAG